MKKFITAVLLSASLVIGGCSALGSTKLEQLQTVAEVAFLAKNVDEMTATLRAVDLNPVERAEVERGLAMFDKIKNQVAKLAKGDIDAKMVMDFPTATQIHKDIGDAYGVIVLQGLKPYSIRTGNHPGQQFIMFDRVGRTIWQKMRAVLVSGENVKLEQFIGQMQVFTAAFAAIKFGAVPFGPSI